jgi:hypothetical protein
MANMASFTMKMTGSNKTLKEVLNLLSAASDEDGWLIPSSILPVDPDEQPKWICFYGPEEWEGDTTAVISGEGKHSPPDAMVRELSLRYPDVLFEVGYNIEYFHEGSFEFSNGVFSEIDYREESAPGEYICHLRDGKQLDPPETELPGA